MKIAILSLPLHTNYGGLLQSYALKTTLEKYGHVVSVLDYDKHPNTKPWYFKPIILLYNFVQKYILKNDGAVFDNNRLLKNYEDYLTKSRLTQKFVDCKITPRIIKSFKEIAPYDYDAIIVGSDQIWRPGYVQRVGLENAYLKFAVGWNIIKLAYAASFGTNEWEYSQAQTDSCRSLVKHFDAISVREDSGVQLCLQNLGCDAKQVLDPTFLLGQEEYTSLFDTSSKLCRGKIFSYILDCSDFKEEILCKISSKLGLGIHSANSVHEDERHSNIVMTQPPVEYWLSAIKNCEFVVTDSFHACVFSIIFKKPFIVVGNERRGLTRLQSLLSMFGLESHLINNIADIEDDLSIYSVPSSVYDILEEQKAMSLDFLINSLNKK